MIPIPEIEKKNPEEIKLFQEQLLQKQLIYLKENSPFYSKLFQTNNIDIEEIKSIEGLVKIPITTKDDLQEFNDDFLCVKRNQIADYVTTSGTSGDPVWIALSDNDLDRLAYNEELSYQCANLSDESIIQLTTTIDRRFMAGLAYFLGARKAGIGIVRVGSGVPELQWDTIRKVKPNALICVPSFLLKMIDYAEENGIDYKNSSIKKVICIGEPLRNQDFTENTLSKRITERWNVQLFSTYASTEMATAFTECEFGVGGHLHPELIIAEFLDENDNPVKNGEAGELTITTVGVEAMPLLRYKTGDILNFHTEKCECGRTTLRLSPLVGRKQQMIKYKGTSLYPPSLMDLLNDFEEIVHHVIEVSSNEINEDEIQVKIYSRSESEELHDKIKDRFRSKVRVSPKIIFVPEQEILKIKFPENSRKSITFVDNRKSIG
ncbi:phenylacetate-CoA ligase [Moheibacter sediminis]|uniref:Phenylacetate-CoA ligase n=2 Tax=Moheibacter sediminis TaxID=1434700 RepID=A0A1W1YGF4_9FLAO|nr:phenylacetate-CoA ligase [Moheibacter sediminis]